MDFSATPTPALFEPTSSAATAANIGLFLAYPVLMVLLGLVMLVATWRIYAKAGQHGWAVLIPIYNVFVLLRITGRPAWWLLLLLIPFLNLIILLVLSIDLAKAFGRSTLFGVVGLFLFGFVGYPMLGFDNSPYLGPNGQTPVQPVPSEPAAPSAPATY